MSGYDEFKFEENTYKVSFRVGKREHDPLATGDSPSRREIVITRVICDDVDVTDEISDSFHDLLIRNIQLISLGE